MKLRNKETGQIGDLMGTERSCSYITICIDFHDGNPRSFDYTSLAELIEEWEDYEPKEPLIRDKNIRKAVRAWADANNITQVSHDAAWNAFRCTDFVIAFDYDFDRHDGLEDGKKYTIAELCGEEEE